MQPAPVYNHVPDLCVVTLSCAAIALARIAPSTVLLPPSLRAVGGISIAVAVFVGGVTLRALRTAATSTNPIDAPTRMLTSGPFGWSRNPLYLAYVLAVLGCALLGGSWAALICPLACFSVLNWLIIPIEERAMLRAFGEEYGLYRHRVRRWI